VIAGVAPSVGGRGRTKVDNSGADTGSNGATGGTEAYGCGSSGPVRRSIGGPGEEVELGNDMGEGQEKYTTGNGESGEAVRTCVLSVFFRK